VTRITAKLETCPNDDQLEDVAAGSSTAGELIEHAATCAACQARIADIRRDNALIEALRERVAETVVDSKPVRAPGYQMIREVHRGSQGVVFEAIQRSTKRRVALKVIASGRFATTRQRARFEREIEIVASLRHPNMVMLYESGITSDGGAFFAMEFVDGALLQDSCRWHEAPIRSTVQLFLSICQAVGYAHRHGVIHRDLKPSNILVDRDGEPRVLDFGLARLVHHAHDRDVSADIAFAGTFAFASPEQLSSDQEQVDTRSDVYALGLIFFQMLTGQAAHASCMSVADLVAARQSGRVPSLRELRSAIDRDLETIVHRALALEPGRRYQSASELVDDLQRYLDGRPIAARQDSLVYVLNKLVQRHRRFVIVASIIALMLIGFGLFARGMFQERHHQRAAAQDTLLAFQRVLEAADPLSGLSAGTPLEAFLEHVGRNIRDHLDSLPESAASIHVTLGQVALNMAEYEKARVHFTEALTLREGVFDAHDPAIAECLHHLGRVSFFLGQYDDAETLYRRALRLRSDALGETHHEVASTMSHLASCLRRRGQFAEAERLFVAALQIRESNPTVHHSDVAASLNNLGSLLLDTGRLTLALEHYDRALEMIEREVGPADWRVAHALRNRAACLNAMERHQEAEADLRRSEAIWMNVVAPDHPSLARVTLELAVTLLHQGRPVEAEALASRAESVFRVRLDHGHPDVLASLDVIGESCLQLGNPETALAPLEESLTLCRASNHPNLNRRVMRLVRLARCHIALNDHHAAETHVQEAMSIIEAGLVEDLQAIDEANLALAELQRRTSVANDRAMPRELTGPEEFE